LYTKKDVGETMEVTFYRQGAKKTVNLKLTKESF